MQYSLRHVMLSLHRTFLLSALVILAILVTFFSLQYLRASVVDDPQGFIRTQLNLTATQCPTIPQKITFWNDLLRAKMDNDVTFDASGNGTVTVTDAILLSTAMVAITETCNDAPPPIARCADTVDNDGDGLKDNKDPGCFSNGPRPPGTFYPAGNAATGTYDSTDNDETHDPWCPNGAIDLPFELCDDGNFVSTDLCKSDCAPAICGDGFIQYPNAQGTKEVCDDGPGNGLPGNCDVTCLMPYVPPPQSQCDAAFVGGGDGWGMGGALPACTESGFGKVALLSGFSIAELMDLDKDGRMDIVGIADKILTYLNKGGLKFERIILGGALEEMRVRYLLMMQFSGMDPVGQQKMMTMIQNTITCFQMRSPRTQMDEMLLYRYQVVQNFMNMDEKAKAMELTTLEHDIADLEAMGAGSSTTGIGNFPVPRSYDLDSDGDQDLLIMSSRVTGGDIISTNLTRCINTDGAFRCSAAGGMMWPWFTALQLDGDPQLEIVVPALDRVQYFDALAPIGRARTDFRLSNMPFYGTSLPGLTTFFASAVGDKLYNGSVIFDAHQICTLTGIPGGQAACPAPSQGTEQLLRIADFDGDKRDDFLAVVSQNGGMDLNVQLNGDRTIGRVPGPVANATGGRKAWIVAVDMDTDGDQDIAGVAHSAVSPSTPATQTVFWLENPSSGTWIEHVIDQGTLGLNIAGGTFRAADLDGDGKPEIFAPGLKGSIYTRSCRK